MVGGRQREQRMVSPQWRYQQYSLLMSKQRGRRPPVMGGFFSFSG
jgi:hypothetical protein